MRKERIDRAAIRYKGGVYSLSRPYRHHDVISLICKMEKIDSVVGEQGFMTTRGRFVTRTEAADIAREAGQIKSRPLGGGMTDPASVSTLFSEDLW